MRIPQFVRKWLLDKVISYTDKHREANQYIGPRENPYMKRWWPLLPRNKFFNFYIHQILRSDYERALHDHPWSFASIVLNNRYTEVTQEGKAERTQGSLAFRGCTKPHRVEITNGPAWTVVFTGPTLRKWGFWCPKGWVPYKRSGTGVEVFEGCPE